MSMYKSKPKFRRMPQVQQYYDLEETIGVASRKKYLEDMKMRIEEAENRGKNIRLRNDWLQHQKKTLSGRTRRCQSSVRASDDASKNKGRTI